jgi:hypothetical protein
MDILDMHRAQVRSVVLAIVSIISFILASGAAFCGNGIVEEGEECDCGYKDDCKDECCNPRDNRQSAADDILKCTLKIVGGVKKQCRYGLTNNFSRSNFAIRNAMTIVHEIML